MLEAVQRANIYSETLGPEQFGIIQKPLTLPEKIYNQAWLRKIAILVVLAAAWEIYGRWLDNPLLVPPFSEAMRALIADVGNGTIPSRALSSIQVLLIGFTTGTLLAGLKDLQDAGPLQPGEHRGFRRHLRKCGPGQHPGRPAARRQRRRGPDPGGPGPGRGPVAPGW